MLEARFALEVYCPNRLKPSKHSQSRGTQNPCSEILDLTHSYRQNSAFLVWPRDDEIFLLHSEHVYSIYDQYWSKCSKGGEVVSPLFDI